MDLLTLGYVLILWDFKEKETFLHVSGNNNNNSKNKSSDSQNIAEGATGAKDDARNPC